MNKTQILEELAGGSPTPAEQQALDEALTDFERDPSPGEPWRNVFREIRATRTVLLFVASS